MKTLLKVVLMCGSDLLFLLWFDKPGSSSFGCCLLLLSWNLKSFPRRFHPLQNRSKSTRFVF